MTMQLIANSSQVTVLACLLPLTKKATQKLVALNQLTLKVVPVGV